MELFLFGLFALCAVGGALAVVLSQNVVRMAFYLVISLGSTAGLFFLLNADFVGATQLLIYVGGTVVLLIFGVMLTATGPYLTIKTSPADLIRSGVIGLAFFFMLLMTVVMGMDWTANAKRLETKYGAAPAQHVGYHDAAGGNTSRSIGMALLGVRPDHDLGKANGSELSTGYLLPFEIISIHLLVVLVGAAYLARAKRRLTRVDT